MKNSLLYFCDFKFVRVLGYVYKGYVDSKPVPFILSANMSLGA